MDFKLAVCKCRVGLLRLQPVTLATKSWEQSGPYDRRTTWAAVVLYQKFAKDRTQLAFQKRHVGRWVRMDRLEHLEHGTRVHDSRVSEYSEDHMIT
jgi:hypothetical protein